MSPHSIRVRATRDSAAVRRSVLASVGSQLRRRRRTPASGARFHRRGRVMIRPGEERGPSHRSPSTPAVGVERPARDIRHSARSRDQQPDRGCASDRPRRGRGSTLPSPAGTLMPHSSVSYTRTPDPPPGAKRYTEPSDPAHSSDDPRAQARHAPVASSGRRELCRRPPQPRLGDGPSSPRGPATPSWTVSSLGCAAADGQPIWVETVTLPATSPSQAVASGSQRRPVADRRPRTRAAGAHVPRRAAVE